MLEEFTTIHREVMATTPLAIKRYLYEKINWQGRVICILGSRGVGKTTLMCQYLLDHYQESTRALYISADNVQVVAQGLFKIAQEYFKWGGEALFIDEVHKYPNWSQEIKNILDTYKTKQIVFSGSSSIELHKSKYDLSRRVVYYELKGLSFREYLHLSENKLYSVTTIEQVCQDHVTLANQFTGLPILKFFRNYLNEGYFPFFLEDRKDYLLKVNNIIEKVIFEDIAVIYNLRQSTLLVLKKLLWLVATSVGLVPNVNNISRNLEVSREIIYNCLEYLDHSGLLNNVYHDAKGFKLARKPGKVYLENTNLLCAIHGNLKLENDVGGVRETFFVNQVAQMCRLNLHDHGDFILDGKLVIEVGGKSKNSRQIKNIEDSYLAVDNIEIGFGKKIPLYLFGFLY